MSLSFLTSPNWCRNFDAVIVLSKSVTLADAAATAIGNLIKQPSDIPNGIEFAKSIKGLKGVIIIKDDNMGVWGEVKICQTFAKGESDEHCRKVLHNEH